MWAKAHSRPELPPPVCCLIDLLVYDLTLLFYLQVKQNHPDFKRKDGGHSLWLNRVPKWVLSELKGKEFDVPVLKSKQANEGRGEHGI